jgi:uncharacterized protein (DUF1499 family)
MLKITSSIGLLMVVAGVFTYRTGLLPFNIAFYGFALGLLICVLATLTIAAAIFRCLARKQPVGNLSVLGIITLSPVIVVLATVGIAGFKAPAIHDITTDLANPPQFIFAADSRKPGENSLDYGGEKIAALQTQAYPDIKTIYLSGDLEGAVVTVHRVIKDLGWQLLGEDIEKGQIEAVDKTPIMGFADDIVIRVKPLSEGVLIDLRSVSRVGVGDLGANAKRIRKFIAKLKIDY